MFYANFVNRVFSSISCCYCCQVDKYANLCLIICSREITKNELNVCVFSHLFPRYENRYSWRCEFRVCYCNWNRDWWLTASSSSVREVKTFRFATFRCKSLKHQSNKKLTSVTRCPLPVPGTELPKLCRTHDPLISARAFRCKFLLPSRLWSFHFIFIALRVVFGSQQGLLHLFASPHSACHQQGWHFAQHALST